MYLFAAAARSKVVLYTFKFSTQLVAKTRYLNPKQTRAMTFAIAFVYKHLINAGEFV